MSSTKGKSRKRVWISLAVIVIVAAGVCWFVLSRGKKAEDDYVASKPLKEAEVGDLITLGTFEQDNDLENGEEPIQWVVIAKEKDRLLVATKYGLDNRQYNHYPADVTWETCTTREYLNGDFYSNHFTDEEKSKILLSTVSSEDNPRWGTSGGNDTEDHIFLLSASEMITYYGGASLDDAVAERAIRPSAYAVARGAWYSGFEGCEMNSICYWTRTPGPSSNSVICVFGDGTVREGDQACYVSHDHYVIRPAAWIDLTAE